MARPEAWLRGAIAGVPPLLQPVAHALVQAREEVRAAMDDFPPARLWDRPAGVAPAGFHLLHLDGVIDRLLTYARGESLGEAQLAALARETAPDHAVPSAHTVQQLVAAFDARVDDALAQLRRTPGHELTAARAVGRQRLPSTAIGLLVHAAEHTTRHVGQLLVTARIVAAS